LGASLSLAYRPFEVAILYLCRQLAVSFPALLLGLHKFRFDLPPIHGRETVHAHGVGLGSEEGLTDVVLGSQQTFLSNSILVA
jgi:hypothetical protein